MPKVVLAGYNVDATLLEEARKCVSKPDALTPETISAAYARISRRSESVSELRAEALREVEKARRSNRRIVFEYGHSSVAEHAVFNFDVLNISRFATEALETHRLASFTEKSQRYVRFDNGWVVPKEVKDVGLTTEFEEGVRKLFEAYKRLANTLEDAVPDADRTAANEDARYVLPLATSTQLGMTVNARTLERMIANLSASFVDEVRSLGHLLFESANKVAPSLLKYVEPTLYLTETRKSLELTAKAAIEDVEPQSDVGTRPVLSTAEVRLLFATPEADERIAASLLHSATSQPYNKCWEVVASLKPRQRQALILRTMEYIEPWDAVLREFEFVDFAFEIELSAAAFAQLKRHRIATLTWQNYEPALGVVVPPRVVEANATDVFEEAIATSEHLYMKLKQKIPETACYALTNAHKRRVLLKLNLRELYHFARLRCDVHAQWEIRNIANQMVELAAEVAPVATALACGKHEFDLRKRQIFPSLDEDE